MGQKSFFNLSSLFIENFKVALKAISSNRLRAVLTIAIIAVGITSLVGILTATEALKLSIYESFGEMGGKSFKILPLYSRPRQKEHRSVKNKADLTWRQADSFKDEYRIPSRVSLSSPFGNGKTVRSKRTETPPMTSWLAVDEDYALLSRHVLRTGRHISFMDMQQKSPVAVLGHEVADLLFPSSDPVGQSIFLSGLEYIVIGVLEDSGRRFEDDPANMVLLPLSNARRYFLGEDSGCRIDVLPLAGVEPEQAVQEAERVFRRARRLLPGDENDFQIRRSDRLVKEMEEMMGVVTAAAGVIGIITLVGSAVGLMNILLVSVQERTREIGTRKAIGASSARIRTQFLIESVVIGQIGGMAGICLGIGAGNVTALLMDAPFILPWKWISLAVLVCLTVSVLSGYVPARRAAELDPLTALRYE